MPEEWGERHSSGRINCCAEHNAGYTKYGLDWFKRPEYQRLVAELGVRAP